MTMMIDSTPDPAHRPHAAVTPADPMAVALRLLDKAHRHFRTACGTAARLGPTEFDAVLTLAQQEPLTHRELAERCSLTSSATTALIDRLEHAGHVTRVAHPTDRRSSLVVLTDTGLDTVRGILRQYDAVLQSVPATGTPAHYLTAVTAALRTASTAF